MKITIYQHAIVGNDSDWSRFNVLHIICVKLAMEKYMYVSVSMCRKLTV